MTQFISTLAVLFGLTYMSWANKQLEDSLRFISLNTNVNIVIGEYKTTVDFVRLGDADSFNVDRDLSKFKVQRISPIFMSKDGNIIITFVKGDQGEIKSIMINRALAGVVNAEGLIADNVLSFDPKTIKTSRGFIASNTEIFDSAKAARAKFVK